MWPVKDCSHWWKIYFFQKNHLQDLLYSLNAVISTNEVTWLLQMIATYLSPKLRNQLTKNGQLDNKVFFKYFFFQIISKSWSPSLIIFREEKLDEFGWFLNTIKMTLKVQNWHFLSANFWVLVRDMKATLGSFFICGQSCVQDLMCNVKFKS